MGEMLSEQRRSDGARRALMQRSENGGAPETFEEAANPAHQTLPRRTFLGVIATLGGGESAMQAADNQTGDEQTGGNQTGDNRTAGDGAVEAHIELAGAIQGWRGLSPQEIEGEENPALNLQVGNRYRVTWENADGAAHNFAIQDAGGNDLLATEITANQGETRSLTFTATREMEQYICVIHPDTMRGEITIGGDGGGNALTQRPVRMVGGMAAAIMGLVVGLSYALFAYFETSHEP